MDPAADEVGPLVDLLRNDEDCVIGALQGEALAVLWHQKASESAQPEDFWLELIDRRTGRPILDSRAREGEAPLEPSGFWLGPEGDHYLDLVREEYDALSAPRPGPGASAHEQAGFASGC